MAAIAKHMSSETARLLHRNTYVFGAEYIASTSMPTQRDPHDSDSNIRISGWRIKHRLAAVRDRLLVAGPAVGASCGRYSCRQPIDTRLTCGIDRRHANDVLSRHGSRRAEPAIRARSATSSGRTPDNSAPWIRPSWSLRRPGQGSALLGDLGVLAVRTGPGSVTVSIRQRSSAADGRAPRGAVFAR
jgi:hypothetical protein